MTNADIQKLLESYEKLPYLSQAYTQSHPNRLATLAHIFQIPAAPITRCRVLELGCAGGGNLIPLAWNLPQSDFVGIEISEVHYNACRRAIDDLGITNLSVRNQSILDVDKTLGTFDYIICHGVFSWVPREVQDKILRIASDHLNACGIAYISYNTYPGWHLKELIRNMMLYHTSHFDDLDQRLSQARAAIDFLTETVDKEGDRAFALALKKERDALRHCDDWYLYHDYLEVVNTPIYFHQFCRWADQHGLQFLAEAQFSVMFSEEFCVQTNTTLEEISRDIIQKEQYMDFLRNRPFRQTLLCKKELKINRRLDAQCLKDLWVASPASPQHETVDLAPEVIEKFRIDGDVVMETGSPELKTALLILKKHWPRSVTFNALLDEVLVYIRKVFGPVKIDRQTSRRNLGRELLRCYVNAGIRLDVWQYDFHNAISVSPLVSRLTRYQAGQGAYVVNPNHERISLDPIGRQIVRLLDGANNRDRILEKLQALAEEGLLQLLQHGLPVTDPRKARALMEERIEHVLSVLAESRLLMG